MRANTDAYVRACPREFSLAVGAVHQRRICVRRKPEVQADLLSPMYVIVKGIIPHRRGSKTGSSRNSNTSLQASIGDSELCTRMREKHNN